MKQDRKFMLKIYEYEYMNIIEAHYENIESLNNLNVTNTVRCRKHVKICAL